MKRFVPCLLGTAILPLGLVVNSFGDTTPPGQVDFGSFAAPARVAREGFRNFYTPDRSDIFAGFRSCAMEE